MRAFGWLATATVLAVGTLMPRAASADSMDPALNRLVTTTDCFAVGPNGTGRFYNPRAGFTPCVHDDAAFAKLVAQYGFAIAPTAMHAARTTGYGGFELGFEAAFTKIDSSASYWQDGTQGPQDPTTKNFSIRNQSPDSLIQNYSMKIRKGFPLGFELTALVGMLGHSNIVTGGADVRWSLFEGFRTGVPAIFPELTVGGSVRTISGSEQLMLTVAGVDAQISKPFPIAGSLVFTPYAGFQWIRIFGDSGLVDLTPNTDALSYCGYKGANTPANKDPNKTYQDGQPICSRGSASSADFNNTAVFAPVRLNRQRLDVGMQWRVQMVKFGAHFVTDLMSASDANSGADNQVTVKKADGTSSTTNRFDGVEKQWTVAVDIGAVF